MTTLNNLQELEEHCATSLEPLTVVAIRDANGKPWLIRVDTALKYWSALAFDDANPGHWVTYRSVYDTHLAYPIETLDAQTPHEPHVAWEAVVAQEIDPALFDSARLRIDREISNEVYGLYPAGESTVRTFDELPSNQLQQLQAAAREAPRTYPDAPRRIGSPAVLFNDLRPVVDVGPGTPWANPIPAADVSAQYPSVDEYGIARMIQRDFRALVNTGTLSFPNWRHVGGKRGSVTWTYPTTAEIQQQLLGMHLSCSCPADMACHADILLEIANAPAIRASDMGENHS